jgi:ProP effector
MTDTLPPDPPAGPEAPPPAAPRRRRRGGARTNPDAQAAPQQKPPAGARTPLKPSPVLERLFALYPRLFGARFVPLKLGVYEDLLARHPEDFPPEDLKLAMGQHARSTRYLESVAAGHPRHDLDGNAVAPVAPEHVHHAILELHRRRHARTPADAQAGLNAQLVARVARAIESSGLAHEDYAVLVRSRDANANAVVDEALATLAAQAAKREALLRAFEASGRGEAEFADMYGIPLAEVRRSLQRARAARTPDA